MSKCPRTEAVQGGRHKMRAQVPDKQVGELLDFRQQPVVDVGNGLRYAALPPVQYEV